MSVVMSGGRVLNTGGMVSTTAASTVSVSCSPPTSPTSNVISWLPNASAPRGMVTFLVVPHSCWVTSPKSSHHS